MENVTDETSRRNVDGSLPSSVFDRISIASSNHTGGLNIHKV